MKPQLPIVDMGSDNLSQGAEFRGMTPEWRERWKALWPKRYRRPFELTISQPHQTLAVSVTGKKCELKCAHCDGHYLEGMADLDHLDDKNLEGRTSLLISGGSDSQGGVPLQAHREKILALSDRYALNIHCGFQEATNLDFLIGRRVTVSLDLIGDAGTIKAVFGLDHGPEEYFQLYLALKERFPVVPHLTVGLNGGRPSGEEQVLKFLAAHPPAGLTFLVFRPTPGTPMGSESPPSEERVVDLIDRACDLLPSALHLGCMRPAGEYRSRLDPLAWLAGARTIVMPDHRFGETLMHGGVQSRKIAECCSLEPGGSM